MLQLTMGHFERATSASPFAERLVVDPSGTTVAFVTKKHPDSLGQPIITRTIFTPSDRQRIALVLKTEVAPLFTHEELDYLRFGTIVPSVLEKTTNLRDRIRERDIDLISGKKPKSLF